MADRLDLRGLRCPTNWAKARVWLDTATRGTVVELLVDDPRAVDDLPRAAEACGHHVVAVVARDGAWAITLEV